MRLTEFQGRAYHLDLGLAIFLDGERKGLLQARLGFANGQEGLVRALGGGAVGRCQDNFERIRMAQGDLLSQKLLGGKSVSSNVSIDQALDMWTG